MMIKMLPKFSIFINIVLIVILGTYCISCSGQNSLCTGDDATLKCLKDNFDELARNNNRLFYTILDTAERKAFDCKTTLYTIEYFELANIKTTNVEFNEYFSESIEHLCFEKPECFFNALAVSNHVTKKAVIKRLKYYPFHEPIEIDEVFQRYKNIKEYQEIMELYFSTE